MLTGFPKNPRALLHLLSRSIPETLDQELIGLYVYGSLVTGGYDDGVSDVDLLAVTTEKIRDDALERLRVMHAQIEVDHPRWRSRVEVAYHSAHALRCFKTLPSPMINISPGEPIHRIMAGNDWLMNWYLVRTSGVTLVGPAPIELIPDISIEEFVEAVRNHARDSEDWFAAIHDRKSQSYAILTMCRALHTVRSGKHHSKQESAVWTRSVYPEWADMIDTALDWRKEPDDAPRLPMHPDGAIFLALMRSHILAN